MIEVPKEVIIENSNFINNTARNYGGAIYNEYTKLKINNTNFKENKAQNITTLYAYNANITQQNTKYTKNTALIACDIYMPFSTINETNITYTNNNSVIKRYIVKRSSDENNYDTSYQIPPIIPSHYNSADYGYVTPSKDQIESGNCWAFASLSTLETCYIKATGKTIDLSVNNMKNLMTLYSKNGWNKLPNTGAFDDMQISYLINWLGPVLDDDKYNTDNHISSELENVIQVNYIYGVPIRSGPLDNEQLKKAVMRYGAVYTTVYVSDRNHNIYRNDTSSINHAVSIIGWDDNYSRENFKNKPAGDGAFIVKNSWGISKTTSEYYYVSYYDTTILTGIDNMIECGGITFKFDNEKYDKQYHYDYSGISDWYIPVDNIATYSNEYEIEENEIIKAFGTYVFDITANVNYTAKIYLNNKLQSIKIGSFDQNHVYQKININPVNAKAGDMVRVELTVQSDKTTGIPVESAYYSRFVPNNLSKINNKSYPDTIAVLKIYSQKATTQINIEEYTETQITVNVINPDYEPVDEGEIQIKYEDEILDEIAVNSTSTIIDTTVYDKPSITINYNYAQSNYIADKTVELEYTPKTTKLTTDEIEDAKVNKTIQITGTLTDENNTIVANKKIILIIDDNITTTKTDKNGRYTFNYTAKSMGKYEGSIYFLGDAEYEKSNTTIKFMTQKLDVHIILKKIYATVGENITFSAQVIDENGNYVNGGNMVFKLNGITLKDDDSFNQSRSPMKFNVEGCEISKTIVATIYIRDAKNLTASYSGSSIYNGCTSDVSVVDIAKRYANITATTDVENINQGQTIKITANIWDTTKNSNNSLVDVNGYIIIKVDGITLKDKNGNQLKVKVENGKAEYLYNIGNMKSTSNGKVIQHEIVVIFTNNNYYPTARDTTYFTVNKTPVEIDEVDATVNTTNNELTLKAIIRDSTFPDDIILVKESISHIIKIDGKTLKDIEDQTIKFEATDGIIDVNVAVPEQNNYNNITIILQDSPYYQSDRITEEIKTVN